MVALAKEMGSSPGDTLEGQAGGGCEKQGVPENAVDDVIQALLRLRRLPFVMHFYSGTAEQAERIVGDWEATYP